MLIIINNLHSANCATGTAFAAIAAKAMEGCCGILILVNKPWHCDNKTGLSGFFDFSLGSRH